MQGRESGREELERYYQARKTIQLLRLPGLYAALASCPGPSGHQPREQKRSWLIVVVQT
jgi:hypothetical protein